MSGIKILCVESEPENMAALTCMLEGIGCEVMIAINAAQAVDLFDKQAIDGVLLDYNLPDTTGAALRAQLKAIRPDIPILVFNALGSQTPFTQLLLFVFAKCGKVGRLQKYENRILGEGKQNETI